MSRSRDLYLHEEIMLLSLKDSEGTVEFGVSYHQALAGAIISELLLKNRIAINEEKKKKLITLKNSKPFGDAILDECIEMVSREEKTKDINHWLYKFSSVKDLKNRVAQGLSHKGILKEDEDRVLFIFTRKIFPETDPGPERLIKQRVENAVMTDTEDITPETVILISIAKQTGILRTIIDKAAMKERKDRIDKLTSGEIIGVAAKEAIEAVHAAVMVACIMPVIITTTTT